MIEVAFNDRKHLARADYHGAVPTSNMTSAPGVVNFTDCVRNSDYTIGTFGDEPKHPVEDFGSWDHILEELNRFGQPEMSPDF